MGLKLSRLVFHIIYCLIWASGNASFAKDAEPISKICPEKCSCPDNETILCMGITLDTPLSEIVFASRFKTM